jgi:hypothetical protein
MAPTAARSAFASNTQEAAMAGREYYELRVYRMRRGPKVKMFNDFLRTAALPAVKRNGIGPVGVFEVMIGPESPSLYLLMPYKSLDQLAAVSDRVAADAEYQKLGAEFINLPATDPGYERAESSLMVAFEGMPKLQVPPARSEGPPRIFELRTYESHSRKANKKKIEMFNTGEIKIFHRAGLQPIFFGETLIGPRLPNLTYMLAFDNMAAHDKAWDAFRTDPEWKKLSTTPGYGDAEIVSSISNTFLRPAPYSEIK